MAKSTRQTNRPNKALEKAAERYKLHIVKGLANILPANYIPPTQSKFDIKMNETDDLINHPPHYTTHPSGIECITIAEHFNFNLGNALKYIWRAGIKEGVDILTDLKKAQWYLDREIHRLTKDKGG